MLAGVMKKQKASFRQESAHPVDVHVGSRVKLRRMALGVSQDTLGKSMGLTFQQIQKYEKGVNRISASKIYELSRQLEVPIDYFFEGYGDGSGFAEGLANDIDGDPFMELIRSPEGVQLCRYFASIHDPDVKKRIVDLVKSIAEAEPAG